MVINMEVQVYKTQLIITKSEPLKYSRWLLKKFIN